MIVAVTFAATPVVVTVNVTVLEPPGTVTVFDTTALVELDVSVIEPPFGGATPLKVTVPVEDAPPRTVLGETVTDCNVAGLTVRVDLALLEPIAAVMVTVSELATPLVVTVKLAEVFPAGTVTNVGT